MALVIAQQVLPFRQPGDKGTQEITMIDFARKPVRLQAARLSVIDVLLRKRCYFLGLKGNPELDA
jgi:hypothetical protein